jgi:hypothetical protein
MLMIAWHSIHPGRFAAGQALTSLRDGADVACALLPDCSKNPVRITSPARAATGADR